MLYINGVTCSVRFAQLATRHTKGITSAAYLVDKYY